MPKKPNLPPLKEMDSNETIGKRIARLRNEKGYTQLQLAEKIGIVRILISDYERGKIRLYDEMLARFAVALEVTTDELLGLKNRPSVNKKN
jgi:transcriptional regulator with XRE-family HTH domain